MQEYIKDIRVNYTRDFTSKDVTKRQIAVATYLIDKLALRAGNEKVHFYVTCVMGHLLVYLKLMGHILVISVASYGQ